MDKFTDRLNVADSFESTFINEFNSLVKQYQIVKYGIESTQLVSIHEFIRFCYDDTSKFVRYIPDSVLINISEDCKCDTTLIEFKAAITGIRSDFFFRTLLEKCPQMEPAFQKKEDVFNIENDALELYLKLRSIGVKVAIIAYANYRAPNDKIRGQFVEKITRCNTYDPNIRGQNVGSGTYIANINFASFEPIDSFFYKNYGINSEILKQIVKKVEKTFEK